MAAAAGPAPIPASKVRSAALGPHVVLAMVVAVPVGLVLTVERYTYDIWGAFIWGPVVLLLTLPVARWVARRTGEPEVVPFLLGAGFLKVVIGPLARYASAEVFYGGVGDSARYHNAGAELADQLRHLDFTGLGSISGTRFIDVLTGGVQAVIGETRMGTFLVFSLFGFVGMCLLYLAFCEALPGGDRRLYRRLLFLFPTMWFWPSSIGKEAFLMLCLGAAVYGLARLFAGRPSGLVPGLLGGWGLAVVRPHFLLMILAGAAASLAFRGRVAGAADGAPAATPKRALAGRAVAGLVLLALLPAVLGSVERFFDIDGLNLESANQVLDEVARRTSKDGSDFTPPDTATPAGFVVGVVTVVLRPFLWEARGAQLLTALESLVLLGVAVVAISRRWSGGWPRALWQQWCRFSLAYVLVFAWAFSVVGNFGILARQRSLMFPMLFVLIAATRVAPGPRRLSSPAAKTSAADIPAAGAELP
jgi:hypothetical protein